MVCISSSQAQQGQEWSRRLLEETFSFFTLKPPQSIQIIPNWVAKIYLLHKYDLMLEILEGLSTEVEIVCTNSHPEQNRLDNSALSDDFILLMKDML